MTIKKKNTEGKLLKFPGTKNIDSDKNVSGKSQKSTQSSEITPISKSSISEISTNHKPPSSLFVLLVKAIENNEIEQASKLLMVLFELGEENAKKASLYYRKEYEKNPDIHTKIMQIKLELINENANEALLLIYQCFGLQGPVAINVLLSLQRMVAPS